MKKRSWIIMFAVLFISCFYIFDLGDYLTLSYIQSQQAVFQSYYQKYPLSIILLFALGYIIITALSLPGAVVLTLLAGALFEFWVGLILVSFASTLGALIAFIFVRYLLRDFVEKKFGTALSTINDKFKAEGNYYLFSLRLIPVFPYFLVNVLMALTNISCLNFYWVSQIGMLPGTVLYVLAGDQLAHIKSIKDILSPTLVLIFILIGIFPLLVKIILNWVSNCRILKCYQKPEQFDYNLVIIGGGAGGLVAANLATRLKAKVALIEEDKMGGDCLYTGCVPSKSLIKSAQAIYDIKNSKKFGIKNVAIDFSFTDIMQRVKEATQYIEPNDSKERYTKLGVHCIKGSAEILDPYRVKVDSTILTTKSIIIATGASPVEPKFEGLKDYYTSDTIWDIKKLPKKLLIIGGGPIGCEIGQCFARLGSKVTIVERGSSILNKEDPDIVNIVLDQFHREKISVLTKHSAKRFITKNKKKYLVCDNDQEIEYDVVVVALGRRPNIKKLGDVQCIKSQGVDVDEYLRTNFPNVYACGDVVGPYKFTHMASYQAFIAVMNALFFPFLKVCYSAVPWCTFTNPEIAHVGLNSLDLKRGTYEVTDYDFNELDRAIIDSENSGGVRVYTKKGSDKILGITIVGSKASEYISEFVLAMNNKIGLRKILRTIHIYPTFSEANKKVAGVWQEAHIPSKLLQFLKWYFGLSVGK